jgi:hypothetical protein
MRITKTVLLFLAVTIQFACAVAVSFSPIRKGILETRGITIHALDGLFTIRSGVPFDTPFNCEGLILHGNIASDFKTALKHGAKTVVVFQEGQSDTLFGVIYFAPIPSTLKGENVASHHIYISDSTMQSARDGLIAYSGTYYLYTFRFPDETIKSAFSWAIWLSNRPFWLDVSSQ